MVGVVARNDRLLELLERQHPGSRRRGRLLRLLVPVQEGPLALGGQEGARLAGVRDVEVVACAGASDEQKAPFALEIVAGGEGGRPPTDRRGRGALTVGIHGRGRAGTKAWGEKAGGRGGGMEGGAKG